MKCGRMDLWSSLQLLVMLFMSSVKVSIFLDQECESWKFFEEF